MRQLSQDNETEALDYNHGEIGVHDTITGDIVVSEIQKWIDVKNIPLSVVLSIGEMQNRESFIDDIITVYKRYNLSLSHEDTQGAFKIERLNDENVAWLKEAQYNNIDTKRNSL